MFEMSLRFAVILFVAGMVAGWLWNWRADVRLNRSIDEAAKLRLSVETMLRFLGEAGLKEGDYRLNFNADLGLVAIGMAKFRQYMGVATAFAPSLDLTFDGDRIRWFFNGVADHDEVGVDNWRCTALGWYLRRYGKDMINETS